MTQVRIYPNSKLNPISRGLLGHFVEIFPGNLQGGIYDPSSPLADEEGFRKDVIEALRELKVSNIRWGGNQSSNYHWIDGVGPKDQRPKRFDYAWHRMYDNQFGTVEFIQMCRKIGAEPVIGVNTGSGTAEEAMNWVEYCNGTTDTYYANLRRSHGFEEPFNVKYWCLGNEEYGPWQFGGSDAAGYAAKARHFAVAMRSLQTDIKLIALGVDSDPDWNMTVARVLYPAKTPVIPGEFIDAISLHYYPLGNEEAFHGTDYKTRMAISQFFHERTRMMRNAIEVAVDDPACPLTISWDEWKAASRDDRVNTVEDALWSTSVFNSFIRDSKYVTCANYTFFVNTRNGPLLTLPDGILRHIEYDAFRLYGQMMGDILIRMEDNGEKVQVDMPLDTKWLQKQLRKKKNLVPREVPYFDMVSTLDSKTGDVVAFVINRDAERDLEVSFDLMESGGAYTAAEVSTIWDEDILAKNSVEAPDRVRVTTQKVSGRDSFALTVKRHSINAIRFTK